jgi:hypothetical protein
MIKYICALGLFFVCFCFFETRSHYVVQVGLKLTVAMAGFELDSSCLSFLSAVIASVCHLGSFELLLYV